MNEWEFDLLEERNSAQSVVAGGVELKVGDRIRLKPRPGGDIFDLALAGQVAVIEAIEQDYEGNSHLAVVVENDPGRDLGMRRQPGHRFFFTPEEVEPMPRGPRILVAGIGNIFLGDDGFGVEVIRRLPQLSTNVTVKDFGIRGYDLAYALLDDYDFIILVDAAPRGDTPGTLSVLGINPNANGPEPGQPVLDAHAMNPVSVMRLACSLGEIRGKLLLVGCEPESLGGEEGEMGLSAAVTAAVDRAVPLLEEITGKLLTGCNIDDLA